MAAGRAARCGFASGAEWMRLALETVRGGRCAGTTTNFHWLGAVKYGLCAAAALAWLAVVWAENAPALTPLAVLVFYAVEASMVFLFPVALDGSSRPFRVAWSWTRRAGGVAAVMRVVMPLAATMLFGGLLGRGFVRCWCLGCLAVCLWYECLRTGTAPKPRPWLQLEVGTCGPLHVRREHVHLGLERPLQLLYVSDLHLGHRWTRRLPEQLLAVARDVRPDLILLGGDLADNTAALPALRDAVAALTVIAPVSAVPGNHDARPGIAAVRAAVRAGGGHWLLDAPEEAAVRIDAAIDATPAAGPRLLCGHYPDIFPAAARAGYRLVLAGHLHGGQCVLGTHRGRLYPAAWLHRSHGLRFVEHGAVMIVSRGAADTLPIRWNCPREVIVCELS